MKGNDKLRNVMTGRSVHNKIERIASIILILMLITTNIPAQVFAAPENIDEVQESDSESSNTEENGVGDSSRDDEEPGKNEEPDDEDGQSEEKGTRNTAVRSSELPANQAAAEGRDLGAYVTDAAVTIKDETEGIDLSEAAEVPVNTDIHLYFEAKLRTGGSAAFRSGDYIDLKVPAAIEIADLGSADGYEIREEDGTHIATVNFTGQGLRFTFTEAVDDRDSLTVDFHISARFNQELVEDGGDMVLEFEIGGKQVNVEISFEESDMIVDKKALGQYEENGVYYQRWQLEVNTKGKTIQNVRVTDTMNYSSYGISYVSSQIRRSNGSLWDENSWSIETTGHDVIFTHGGVLKEAVYIEIITKVDDFLLLTYQSSVNGNISYLRIYNNVKMEADDKNGEKIEPVKKDAMLMMYPDWVVKKGTISAKEGVISWTLTGNQNKATLSNARIRDIVPAGLEVDMNSISGTVVQAGATRQISQRDCSITSQSDGTTLLEIDLGDMTGAYSVSYQTKITSALAGKTSVENIAWLVWEAEGEEYRSPDYKYKVDISTSYIEKSGGNWWATRQYSEWYITLNPDALDLKGKITVEDTLPIQESQNGGRKFYQIFNRNEDRTNNDVAGYINNIRKEWLKMTVLDENGDPSGEIFTEGDEYQVAFSNGNRTLTIAFKEDVLDGKSVRLYVESDMPLEDNVTPVIANSSFTYKNTVKMFRESTLIGEDSASVSISPTIGAKTALFANRHTKDNPEGEWRVTVNPQMLRNIGEVSVRDILNGSGFEDLLEFAEENGGLKYRIYENTISYNTAYRGDYITYRRSEDTIRYPQTDAADVTDREGTLYTIDTTGDDPVIVFNEAYTSGKSYSIYFYTHVTDLYYALPRTTTSYFRNYSYIGLKKYDIEQGYLFYYAGFPNTPLTKSGNFDENEGAITWEAGINEEAHTTELAGIILEDQLQDGLVLDIASVKLQKKVGSNYYDIDFDYDTSISYDYDENLFSFTLPQYASTDGNKNFYPGYAYRLIFSTDVLVSGDYTNTIIMKGYSGGNPTISTGDIHAVLTSVGGGASSSKKLRITLQKTDQDGRGLSGAAFELRTGNGDTEGILLETGISDNTGKISFRTLLSRQMDYYLKETEAPRGYRLSEEIIPVRISASAAENDPSLIYTAVNEQILVPVTLNKVDEKNKGIGGAVFSVTPFYWQYDGNGERTPVAQTPYPASYVSRENGTIDLGELPFGLYAVREERAPDGYMLPESFLVVEITHPLTPADGDYRVLYWNTTENGDGTYKSVQQSNGKIVNELQSYKLTIYKTDADTNQPLAGAEFKIYASDEKKSKGEQVGDVYTTNERGQIEVYLTMGHYLVEETKAPFGYKRSDGSGNENPRYIHISPESASSRPPATAASGAAAFVPEFQLNFKNGQMTTNAEFKKIGAGSDAAGLKGARFNLYKIGLDESGTITYIPAEDEVMRVETSDVDGMIELADLSVGLYVLQEAIAPAGYERSMTAYGIEVSLSADGSGLVKDYYLIEGGRSQFDPDNWRSKYKSSGIEAEMKNQGYYTIENEVDIVRYNFTIYKRDEDNRDVPLAGARFKIFMADEDGKSTGEQFLEGAVQIITLSGIDYVHITDFAGEINVQLPAGKYMIEEVQVPAGYILDTNTSKTDIEVKANDSGRSIVITNKQNALDIIFTKVEKDSNKKLPDADFNLYSFEAEELNNDNFPIYDGSGLISGHDFQLVDKITSNLDGNLELKGLTPGWYGFQEVAAPSGYERSLDMWVIHVYTYGTWIAPNEYLGYNLYYVAGGMSGWAGYRKLDKSPGDYVITNSPLTEDLSHLTVQKTDDEGNAMAGIGFYLSRYKDTEKALDEGKEDIWIYYDGTSRRVRLTTDEMGIARMDSTEVTLTPGYYYLHEIEDSVPAGYEMSEAVEVELKFKEDTYVVVENKRKTTDSIKFFKRSRYGTGLQGAVFNLYRIDGSTPEEIAEIAALDDPTQYIRFYKQIVSETDGTLAAGELPFGYYILQEAVAADGYIRNLEEIIGIEITTEGDVVLSKINRADRTYADLDDTYDKIIYNDLEGFGVRILKEDYDTKSPLVGAEFKIYDENDVQILVKGVTEEGTYITDERGEIVITLTKGNYTLEEVRAPEGYTTMPDQDLTIEVNAESNETVAVIANQRRTFSLAARKMDEDGSGLPDAVFNLYSIEVDDSAEPAILLGSTFITTITSDENGHLDIPDMSVGRYVLQEAIAPDGYYRSLDALVFTIEEGADPEDITIYVYDVFGGMANAGNYTLRAEYDLMDFYSSEDKMDYSRILIDNQPMDGSSYQMELQKVNRYSEEDTEMALGGALFSIWRVYNGQEEVQVTKGANADGFFETNDFGRFSVYLYPGEYRITEEQAPDGYLLDKDNIPSYRVVIREEDGGVIVIIDDEKVIDTVESGADSEILIPLEVENEAAGTLEVRKIDAIDGASLSGAEFILWRRSDDSLVMIDMLNSKEMNSEWLISNLRPGKYVLEETKAPLGYSLLDESIEFEIAAAHSEIVKKVKNTPDGEVTIRKVDGDGNALKGAEFALYHKAEGVEEEKRIGIYDMSSSSIVHISELRAGEYLLYETKAPDGYQELDKPITFTITAGRESETITVENMAIETVTDYPVTIRKVDEAGTPLKGAEFSLCRRTENGETEEEIAVYDMSDISELTIDNLVPGEYLLYETKAPQGYQILDGPKVFEVKENSEKIELTIKNMKAEEPESETETEPETEPESESETEWESESEFETGLSQTDDEEPKKPDREADKGSQNSPGKKKSDSVKTGDFTIYRFYILGLFISVMAIFLLWKKRVKKDE